MTVATEFDVKWRIFGFGVITTKLWRGIEMHLLFGWIHIRTTIVFNRQLPEAE